MKICKLVLATLVAACAAAGAQVVPAISGPELPLSGTLRYDLRYGQIAQFYAGAEGDRRLVPCPEIWRTQITARLGPLR